MTERPNSGNNWGDPHDYVGTVELGVAYARDDETRAMFNAALDELSVGRIPDNMEQLVRAAKALAAEFGGPAR